ncbi:unnamed protein product [Ectocarpus sp. 4 AP-2014]
MAGRGRGGRFGGLGGNSRGKSVAGGRGGSDASALARVLNTADCCACVSNGPLLVELKSLDEECLRTGKVKLRHGLMRAIKSLKRYPLPITTEKEACALEGVGSFTARRMLRGLPPAGPEPDNSSGVRRTDEENIEPSGSSTFRGGGARESCNNSTGTSSVTNAAAGSRLPSYTNSLLRMNLRVGSNAPTTTGSRPLSLASNFAALRGGGGETTPEVTPKRPTSRPRREEAGGETVRSSKAPSFFSGQWEAWLIVDNREHEFMSVQSSLLQKRIRCETRQLPLGDMLWIARRRDDPTSEVLLGYIVERKTASDLASSIIDGRYEEQKRRLKLSGLRRRIYLVEGNLNHQEQLAPAALRAALVSSQACGGLAVVQCDSLRDTVDFLARTHRHIASLLEQSCRRGTGLWPVGGSRECSGGGSILRPAMTYGEYAQGCAKRAGSTTVRQVLGAMVRQAPGCSAARAEAIVRAFDSPLGLMLALERAANRDGIADDDTARMKRADALLGGLVCSGGAGTNKLPQPLRRLLCRLFLGDSVDDEGAGTSAGGVGAAGPPREAHGCGRRGHSSADLSVGGPYCVDGWDAEPMNQDDPY